jgi:hypothetical protein
MMFHDDDAADDEGRARIDADEDGEDALRSALLVRCLEDGGRDAEHAEVSPCAAAAGRWILSATVALPSHRHPYQSRGSSA